MFSFEKLEVWQMSKELVGEIYKLSKDFPSDERYGLTQHIRKSAISVMSNIAEGISRFSKADFQRFIEIAIGSTYELVSQLFVSSDNGYIKQEVFKNMYNKCESIAKMLSSLSNSLDKKTINHKP